jgi:uncharacterized surface protein with fasciclin (FAS1) repeats
VAKNAGNLKILLKLLSDLDHVVELKKFNSVTIFAPSDEAFKKLPADILQQISYLWGEYGKERIINRHTLLNTTLLAADITTGPLETNGKEDIYLFKTNQGGVRIYHHGKVATVVTADVKATNGVIHIIDNVLL